MVKKSLSKCCRDVDPDSSQDEQKREKSYQIIGSMTETGLGCVLWWAPSEDDANNEGDEKTGNVDEKEDNT